MRYSKNITTLVVRLFQFACFILAGYMAFEQLKFYIANHDFSSLSYRKFNAEADNLYPSYSFCIESKNGDIFNKGHQLRGKAGHQHQMYYQMLEGEQELGKDFTSIRFEDRSAAMVDLIAEKSSFDLFGDVINEWKNDDTFRWG